MKKLFDGDYFFKDIKPFRVHWESNGQYRYWCFLENKEMMIKETLCVVMFNPGSLSGNGDNFLKDTTLRNLRKLFQAISKNCLVLNLFDYATPDPDEISNNWDKRISGIDITKILLNDEICISSFFFGYGNLIEGNFKQLCLERVNEIRSIMSTLHINEIEVFNTADGNPVHPYSYNFKHPNKSSDKTSFQKLIEILQH